MKRIVNHEPVCLNGGAWENKGYVITEIKDDLYIIVKDGSFVTYCRSFKEAEKYTNTR